MNSARKPWGVLKFVALTTVSAAVGGTGYVSYGTAPNPCPARGPCGPDAQLRGLAPLGDSAWPGF